ncbi:MAG TPA: amidohydrolase family protein, partial [Roseiarcus sp.]
RAQDDCRRRVRRASLQVGVDRIMFSTDHPYQSMAKGRAFLDRLPVSDGDRERIAHGNAERLFGA